MNPEDARTVRPLTYTQIWGPQSRWTAGPGVLSDIVHWLHRRHLQVDTQSSGNRITLDVPIPEFVLEGSRKPFDHLVPDPLLDTFRERLALAGARVYNMSEPRLRIWMRGGSVTPLVIQAIQSTIEADERARFEARQPTLQMCVAESFGFFGSQLPPPAGLALQPLITGEQQ